MCNGNGEKPCRFSLITTQESEELENPLRTFRRKVLRLIPHALIATVGCMISGFIIIRFLNIQARGPHYFTIRFFTDVPYTPACWGSALVVGFMRGRQTRDKIALLLGPIATLLLALLILSNVPGYSHSHYERAQSNNSFATYTWGALFSVDPNKCPGDECLGKLMFTAPVLNCIAYSVGIWLALRSTKGLN